MEHFDWLKGFVFPYINLLIFLFLAYKLFKKPTVNFFANRRKSFEARLADAHSALKKAEERNRELSARLSKLQAEIEGIERSAREISQTRAEEMVERAKQLSKNLKEEARNIAETELARARQDLQKQILAEIKANVSEKIRTEMDDLAQRNLVRHKVNTLPDLNMEAR